jgi:hypothetical protein
VLLPVYCLQSKVITAHLKRADANHGSVGRLSRSANRIGLALITGIFAAVGGEAARMMLVENGGMVYWWVMLPIWSLFLGSILAAISLQIVAFQPPSQKTTPRVSLARRTSTACSPNKHSRPSEMKLAIRIGDVHNKRSGTLASKVTLEAVKDELRVSATSDMSSSAQVEE